MTYDSIGTGYQSLGEKQKMDNKQNKQKQRNIDYVLYVLSFLFITLC